MMSMKKLKSIIVDDESLAREDLRRLLGSYEYIDILGEASSVEEATELVSGTNPDIVFLDIQLGSDSGFDLVPHLQKQTKIVFVTAFDEYAIRAFEVNAQDYLLKPVSVERLSRALEKITSGAAVEKEGMKKLEMDDSIFLKLDVKYQFVKVGKIKLISSAGDYSEVIIEGEKKERLTNKTLKEWEERLPGNHFCRIHRFTIINIDFIEKIEPWHNYSQRVYIKGLGKPYLMSRRYFSIIKGKLG